MYDIWLGFEADDELLCKTVVLVSPCTVNDYSLLVPKDASIMLIYTSLYLASACFGWSPSLGSFTTKLLKIDSNKLVLVVLRSNMVQQNVKTSICNAPKTSEL